MTPQRVLYLPSGVQTATQARVGDTNLSRPFGNGHPPALMLNEPVRAGVVHLLSVGRPPAVVGRVRAVVVDAIKLMTFWTRTHVGKERREVLEPPIANNDAAPSVPVIPFIRRLVAAFLRCAPSPVLAREFVSVGSSALSVLSRLWHPFFPETATAIRSTDQEIPCTDKGHGATLALATPPGLYALPWLASARYRETTEDASGQIVFQWTSGSVCHSTILQPSECY